MIPIKTVWHNANVLAEKQVSQKLHEWLRYAHSFMERLREYGIDAKIEVMSESWLLPDKSECEALKILKPAFVREVIIRSEQRFWMYARTIVPEETMTGQLPTLTALKNRPIGSILFSDPDMLREAFSFAYLSKKDFLFQQLLKYHDIREDYLWARRSIFAIKNNHLLLTEVFFPEIETL